MDALLATGDVVELHKPLAYISRRASDAAFQQTAASLERLHAMRPWLLGATVPAIARELGVADALAIRLLAAWHDDGRIASTGPFWHAPSMAPSLTAAQREFFIHALRENPASPLLPKSYDEIVRQAGSARIEGLNEVLETLLASGALVRIADDLYRRAQITHARTVLATVFGAATMAQVRDAFGTSRRYALPLMEHFDGIGVTVRDGDLRRLRKVAHPATR